MSAEIDQKIESFCINTLKGLSLLYENRLYGQVLVLIYSFIDSAGLLDAPSSQSRATGESFKNWVKKYITSDPQTNFNEVDLWSARCAVLHTFTSQSDLSNSGNAKELHYFSGPNDSSEAQAFISQIKTMQHIPVHIDGLYQTLLKAIEKFAPDLATNCESDKAYEIRLNKVLQQYSVTTSNPSFKRDA